MGEIALGAGRRQGKGGELGHTFQGAGNKSLIERDRSGDHQLHEGRSFCPFDHCYLHQSLTQGLSRYLWASDRKEKKIGTVSQKPRVGGWHLGQCT